MIQKGQIHHFEKVEEKMIDNIIMYGDHNECLNGNGKRDFCR